MGCIESLKYEIILKNVSFSECRDYIRENCAEFRELPIGEKIFDSYVVGQPPVLVGIEGLPVLTSVAYHYKVDLNDVSAANVTALTLALGLVLIAVFAFLVLRRHGRMA